MITFVRKVLTMVVFLHPVAIGSDHAGFHLKETVTRYLNGLEKDVKDYGAFSETPVDYPDVAHILARDVDTGIIKRGILLCGTGNGMSMTANKYRNVRAALCWNGEIARFARLHNDANILVLPARHITPEEALHCVDLFFSTEFEGGRHLKRVGKINQNL